MAQAMHCWELTVPGLWMVLQPLYLCVYLALLESPESGAVASLHAYAILAFVPLLSVQYVALVRLQAQKPCER